MTAIVNVFTLSYVLMNMEWYNDRLSREDLVRSKTISSGKGKHRLVGGAIKVLRVATKRSKLLKGRGTKNAYDVRLIHQKVKCGGLPSDFNGFKILHFTDLHLDSLPGLEYVISDLVSGVRADVAAFTGDYIESVGGPHFHIIEPFEKIISSLSCDNVLATLGNHDTCRMVPDLESLGIRVLNNEIASVKRGNERICIIGLDDVHKYMTPSAISASRRLSCGDFNLALVHSPEAHSFLNKRVDFYITGHTHGGQVCLPGGKIMYNSLGSDCDKSMLRGFWYSGDMLGYTSCGAGTSVLPVRYFSRGEVTLFELISEKQ